ncbi:hypothetical protein [Acetobacter indonesiensis]|uniref:hypothetical protein n=1 Tax=Acetobacter indonesiensis TaxID=104101 RepID=UPI0039E9BBEC
MDFNALANAHDAFNLPQIVILNDTLKAPESSWNTVLTDWVKAIGIGSLITGVMMYCVARGQLKIAKYQHVLGRNQLKLTRAQFKLAEEQANTSREQKEIAKQKLKLELFELRYNCHKTFKDCYNEFRSCVIHKDFYFLHEKFVKCDSICDEMVILFNGEVRQTGLKLVEMMLNLCDLKRKQESKEISNDEYYKECCEKMKEMGDLFVFDYQKKVKSFLNFEGLDAL